MPKFKSYACPKCRKSDKLTTMNTTAPNRWMEEVTWYWCKRCDIDFSIQSHGED